MYNKYFNKKPSLYASIIEDRYNLYADKIFNWITNFKKDKVNFSKGDVFGALRVINTFSGIERTRNKIINNETLFNNRIYSNVEDDLSFWNSCYLHIAIHENTQMLYFMQN